MNAEAKKRISLRLKAVPNSCAFACTKFPTSTRKSTTFEIKSLKLNTERLKSDVSPSRYSKNRNLSAIILSRVYK